MSSSNRVTSSRVSSSKSSNKASGTSASAAAPPAQFKSKVEEAILKSCEPIQINETKEITVNKEKGIWANRCEVCTWKGDMPITEYPVNEDPCPEVITKKPSKKIEYNQEIAVRYLKPPAPPAPGDIIIKQEPNKPSAPAPPIVIRQQPPRPCTPEPLVIREAPPPAPPCIGQKVITIAGKTLPAPPRKVVVERLPLMPPKPQPVIVERWMPYAEQKRRVIFQQAPPDPVVCKPKNIIVQWEAPDVCVKKDIKHLGVVCANPCEYVQKYGATLKKSSELPQFVKDIAPQCGIELAANKKYDPCPVFELCGDICALNKVDLEKEGLGAYKSQLREKCGCPPPATPQPCPSPPQPNPCDDPCVTPCPSSRKSSASCVSAESPCSASYSTRSPASSPALSTASVEQSAGSPTYSHASRVSRNSSKYSSANVHYGAASGSGSASANVLASTLVYGAGSASANYTSGYASGYGSSAAQCASSSFGSTTLYGSNLGSFSLSEGASYTPLSFNY